MSSRAVVLLFTFKDNVSGQKISDRIPDKVRVHTAFSKSSISPSLYKKTLFVLLSRFCTDNFAITNI